MSEIFHIVGLCPDSFAHWDLLDMFAATGADFYYAWQSSRLKFISWFEKF